MIKQMNIIKILVILSILLIFNIAHYLTYLRLMPQ